MDAAHHAGVVQTVVVGRGNAAHVEDGGRLRLGEVVAGTEDEVGGPGWRPAEVVGQIRQQVERGVDLLQLGCRPHLFGQPLQLVVGYVQHGQAGQAEERLR